MQPNNLKNIFLNWLEAETSNIKMRMVISYVVKKINPNVFIGVYFMRLLHPRIPFYYIFRFFVQFWIEQGFVSVRSKF